MRTRELALVVVCAVVACRNNPDPRKPTVESMQREAWGGWISARMHDGSTLGGELLALDASHLYMLSPGEGKPRMIDRARIESAELFEYMPGTFTGWGLLGVLSTISHGAWLVFSAPIWSLFTIAVNANETRHMIVSYPGDGWEPMARWARFPQGPPPRLLDRVDPRHFMPPSLTPVRPLPGW